MYFPKLIISVHSKYFIIFQIRKHKFIRSSKTLFRDKDFMDKNVLWYKFVVSGNDVK